MPHLVHLKAIVFFFFNDTATTEIYTLSLHDALPISSRNVRGRMARLGSDLMGRAAPGASLGRCLPPESADVRGGAHAHPQIREEGDRKSTRLNSSHGYISYAVFCLKKKKKKSHMTKKK